MSQAKTGAGDGDSPHSDIGYDERFTLRWLRAQYYVLAAVLTVLVLGASGLLGRSGLSERIVAIGEQTPGLHYERIVRSHAPASIELDLPLALPEKADVPLWLTGSLVAGARVTQIMPMPLSSAPARDGVMLTFKEAAPGGRIWMQQTPTVIGLQHGTLRVGETGKTVPINQLVLP